MPTPEPFTEDELLSLSGSAMRKIDKRGRRGTEKVTRDEIEAMAALLQVLGAGPACDAAFAARIGRAALADDAA